ncbi:unnamed protein product [Caenorhabditis brenneri]
MILALIGTLFIPIASPSLLGLGDLCSFLISVHRSSYAEQHQIANMNDLKFNRRLQWYLEKNFDMNAFDCSEPYNTTLGKLDIFSGIPESALWTKEIMNYPYLFSAPGRTEIACWKKKCERTGEDVYSLALTKSSTPPIFGPLGSECAEANPFGLCKPNKLKSSKDIEREIYERHDIICSADPNCKKVLERMKAEAAQYRVLHRMSNPYGIPINYVVNLGHNEAKSAFKVYRKRDGNGIDNNNRPTY